MEKNPLGPRQTDTLVVRFLAQEPTLSNAELLVLLQREVDANFPTFAAPKSLSRAAADARAVLGIVATERGLGEDRIVYMHIDQYKAGCRARQIKPKVPKNVRDPKLLPEKKPKTSRPTYDPVVGIESALRAVKRHMLADDIESITICADGTVRMTKLVKQTTTVTL